MATVASLVPPYEVSDQALLLVCLSRAARAGLIDAEHQASLKDLVLWARPALIAAARAYRETKDEDDLLDSLLLIAGLPPVPPRNPSAPSPVAPAPATVSATCLFGSHYKPAAVPIVAASALSSSVHSLAPKLFSAAHGGRPSFQATKFEMGLLQTITAMDAYQNVSLEEIRASTLSTSPMSAPANASVAFATPARGSPPTLPTPSTLSTPVASANPFKAAPQLTMNKFVSGALQKKSMSLPSELKVQLTMQDTVVHVSTFRIGVLGPAESGKSALISLLVDGVSAHQRPSAAIARPTPARTLQLHTNVGVLNYDLLEGRTVPAQALHGAILVASANAPIEESIASLAVLRAALPSQCAVYVALSRSDELSRPLKKTVLATLVARTAPALGAAVLSARTGSNAERPLLYISRTLCGFPLLTFEPQPAPPPQRSELSAAPRYVW